MRYVNEYDMMMLQARTGEDPVVDAAIRDLGEFIDLVNRVSDGWAYWAPAQRAARRLIDIAYGDRPATERELTLARAQIKRLRTRHGV